MRRLTVLITCLSMTAAGAFAQTAETAPEGNNSHSALLIMTGIVLAVLLLLLWLVPKSSRSRRRKAKSIEEAAPGDQGVQAAAAFSAFEKAKLVGKKAQEASTKNVAAGEPASDEQAS